SACSRSSGSPAWTGCSPSTSRSTPLSRATAERRAEDAGADGTAGLLSPRGPRTEGPAGGGGGRPGRPGGGGGASPAPGGARGEACSRAVTLHRAHDIPDLVEVALVDGDRFTVRVIDRAPIDAALGPALTDPPDPVALLDEPAVPAGAGDPATEEAVAVGM